MWWKIRISHSKDAIFPDEIPSNSLCVLIIGDGKWSILMSTAVAAYRDGGGGAKEELVKRTTAKPADRKYAFLKTADSRHGVIVMS